MSVKVHIFISTVCCVMVLAGCNRQAEVDAWALYEQGKTLRELYRYALCHLPFA